MESQTFAYFHVSINNGGLLTSVPSDGFIDDFGPREWSQHTSFPASFETSLAKTRAKMRWNRIVQRISTNVNPLKILNVQKFGATVDTPASSITFTVVYDREDSLYTKDEFNQNSNLTGEDALQREVVRALMDTIQQNIQTYDPSNERGGDRMDNVVAGPLAPAWNIANPQVSVTRVQFT